MVLGAGWLAGCLVLAGWWAGLGWAGLGWGWRFSGRLRPSPAVSGRLRPSPAVSSLKDASGFPLKIVNCQLSIVNWPLSIAHCQLFPIGASWLACWGWGWLAGAGWGWLASLIGASWLASLGWRVRAKGWLAGSWRLVAEDWALRVTGWLPRGLGLCVNLLDWLVGWLVG